MLIPDIALTHLGLLVGTISIYKPALLLAEEGTLFNSKCLPYPSRRIDLDPVRGIAGDVQGARAPNTGVNQVA